MTPAAPSGALAAFSPVRQLALQGAAALLVLALVWPYYGLSGQTAPWREIALFTGGLACLFSVLNRQPWWWRVMHGLFAPLVWLVGQWAIDPGWFLLAFFLLLLVYRGAVTGQVPLYLSNRATVDALERFLADFPSPGFVDLGAGVGTTLLPLAERHPAGRFTGVENAPLPWLVGKLRCRLRRGRDQGRSRVDWRWADLWATDLGEFDVVYAFLSPAPMPALWQKAKRQMRPGSFLVSNRFPVPDVEPTSILAETPSGEPLLYCYRIESAATGVM